MKCYVHRDVDAIGVCSECGQGMCDICSVRIGGKLYCKDDADRVFGPKKRAPKEEIGIVQNERPMRVMVTSVLYFLYGAFGIGIGLIFIGAGFASGIVSSLPGASSVEYTSIGLLGLGGVLLVMGILGIICGVWLWKVQTLGAVVGIPLLIGGLAIATLLMKFFPILTFYEIGGTVWVVNMILLITMISSWTRLRWAGEVEPDLV